MIDAPARHEAKRALGPTRYLPVTRRAVAFLGLAAALGLIVGVALLLSAGGGDGDEAADRSATGMSGSRATFAFLATQRTNRCDLQAAEIRSYPAGRRMQGSCCTPMDEATYRRQVSYLRSYAALGDVPRDPYDIRAGLAQRLLRFDRTIVLTAGERAKYRRAMAMSRLKGPCCCRCWRWEAFRGMSKHLIVAHGYGPRRWRG